MPGKKKAPAALEYLSPAFFERNPRRLAQLEELRSSKEIARAIYDLRSGAGFSQRELARAAGVTPRTIERLEADEYPRHSLGMLRRIAAALGKKVELKIVAAKGEPRSRSSTGTGSPARSKRLA